MFRSLFLALLLPFALIQAEEKMESSWLYVIQAKSGKLVAEKEKDVYTLRLYDVPNAVAFTDRPSHDVKLVPVQEIAENWNKGSDSFKKDPPNAAFGLIDDVDEKVSIFELSEPQYNKRKKMLTFKVTHLKEPSENPLAGRKLHDEPPMSFKECVLVIDGIFFGGTGRGTG